MMNSEPSLTKPLPTASKSLVIIFLALAFLGFLDAAYLTAFHYRDFTIPCPITGECETVLVSKYATIGPIPVALLGALYYLILLILTIIYLDTENLKALRLATTLTWAGFLTSLLLIWLQLFVIYAICIYCMGSALISILLWILGLSIKTRLGRRELN